MKTILLSVFTAFSLFTATSVFAQSAERLKPGDELPAATVSLKSTDGKAVTLKSAIGKNGLLVMFSCNTCPFVVKMNRLLKKQWNMQKHMALAWSSLTLMKLNAMVMILTRK